MAATNPKHLSYTLNPIRFNAQALKHAPNPQPCSNLYSIAAPKGFKYQCNRLLVDIWTPKQWRLYCFLGAWMLIKTAEPSEPNP